MNYIKELIQLIQRKDIYYCIIPLSVCLLNILYKILDKSQLLNGWRIYEKSNSLDKYTIFQSKIMVFQITISLFLYLLISSLTFPLIIKVQNATGFNKLLDIIFIFVCIISYIINFFILKKLNNKNNIIRLNGKIKNNNQIVNVAYYLPTIIECIAIVLCTIFRHTNIIILTLAIIYHIILIGFYLFMVKILDDNVYYEYKYICFNFNDGKKLEDILVKNIQKKGKWIIAKVDDEHEIRFRYESVNSVEYKNKTLLN